jgi:hypothetical protein
LINASALTLGLTDHQVCIEKGIGALANPLDHHRPKGELGTKWPSITSRCTIFAPARVTWAISDARFAKSALRIDGDSSYVPAVVFSCVHSYLISLLIQTKEETAQQKP